MPAELHHLVADFAQYQQITQAAPAEKYLHEDVYNSRATALAILQPNSTEQVQSIVRFALTHRIALVPQGGNSNRTVAALPQAGRPSIIVSMERMNRIEHIANNGESMTVQAGCTLAQIQQAAEDHGRLFGLDLGARDWCQIGGNISTNAGGMQCVRYQNMREQILGLEVITPAGEKLNMLNSLKKNNTGYDLKHLFVGAEGTLGIITRAVLRLHPLPHFKRTAAIACNQLKDALSVFHQAQEHWGQGLQRIEFLGRNVQQVVAKTPSCPPLPFADNPEALLLLEISGLPNAAPFEDWLATLLEAEIAHDILPAISPKLEQQLWDIRERCGACLMPITGPQVKHDIAVPPDQQPAFLHKAQAALAAQFPQAVPLPFGHWGDGNIHFSLYYPTGTPEDFTQQSDAIHRLVEDMVVAHGGTFSAEHGIGTTKKDALYRLKDPATLALMQQIKRTLDPHNIMNPDKIFHA